MIILRQHHRRQREKKKKKEFRFSISVGTYTDARLIGPM